MASSESPLCKKSDCDDIAFVKGCYIWAKLPGCCVKWPVRVEEVVRDKIEVYCHSDDSLFTVNLKNADSFEKCEILKDKGIVQLKKKRGMLCAFLSDYEIAKSEQAKLADKPELDEPPDKTELNEPADTPGLDEPADKPKPELDELADTPELDEPADTPELDGPADKAELNVPADKAELDEPADKAELDEPADKAELDEPADKPKLDEPADKAELDEPAGKAELDEPADKAELGEPADKAELDEPADKAELDEPADKAELDEPADKPKLDEPADTPELDEPADKAELDEPADTPELDEPAEKPKLDEPADKAELDEPADTPELDEPADKAELDEPADKAELDEPADKPKLDEPADLDDEPDSCSSLFSSSDEYVPNKEDLKQYKEDQEDDVILNSDDSDSNCSEVIPVISKFLKPSPIQTDNVIQLNGDDEDDEDIFDEDEILRSKSNPGIYIRKVITSDTGKNGKKKKCPRVFNSYQFCDMCDKKVSNFAQHIFRKHKNNGLVKDISGKNDVKERKKLICLLRSRFNHKYNLLSIERKKGEIILDRRPSNSFDLKDYGPCPSCLGWIKKKLLWKHQKACQAFRGSFQSKSSLLTQSDMLSLRLKTTASKRLVEEVFKIMNHDEVGTVARSDELIVMLGNQWMDKNFGNKLNRGKYTSQVMRLNARLLINLRSIKPLDVNASMSDYLKPEHFDECVEATMKTAERDIVDEDEISKPSVLLKLGFDIKRMANAKVAKGIQTGCKELRSEAEDFLKLMDVNWGTRVTKIARVTLNERHYNKEKSLPDPTDIEKLNDYLKKAILEIDYGKLSYENFSHVAELISAKLVIYNRRRTGELEALRLGDYRARIKGVDETDQTMASNCTEFEKYLLQSQEVLEIRGKTGRGVPVILPPEVSKGLEFLANTEVRSEVGIHPHNIYLFANKGHGVIRAYDSLSKAVKKASLASPERVTSTNLRKYMATITQVLDLRPNELQWVTNHLGHTLDVHKIYYRSTSDVIERMQIAKILLLQDTAQVNRFVNKSLEDIQLEDIIATDEPYTGNAVIEDDFVKDPYEDEDEDVETDEPQKKKRKSCLSTKLKWTEDEEAEIKVIFEKYIEKKQRPKPKAVDKALKISKANNGYIHKRSKDTLKKKLFRIIDRLNKNK